MMGIMGYSFVQITQNSILWSSLNEITSYYCRLKNNEQLKLKKKKRMVECLCSGRIVGGKDRSGNFEERVVEEVIVGEL